MADFTIYRQGLDATIVGSASIGAQSEAVTFTVESDGSYAGYKTNLYYQYGDTRALAAASNNVFTVPVQAFKQTGDVLLSVELSSGSNRPVCNPCVLRVTSSAKKTDASVLPSDGTWQALVETAARNEVKSEAQSLQNQIDALSTKSVVLSDSQKNITSYNDLSNYLLPNSMNRMYLVGNNFGFPNSGWAVCYVFKVSPTSWQGFIFYRSNVLYIRSSDSGVTWAAG